jgi:hypothetical protein
MTEHLREHKKDKHSLRGLQAMLSLRRKQIAYLARKDPAECDRVLEMFSIKRHTAIGPDREGDRSKITSSHPAFAQKNKLAAAASSGRSGSGGKHAKKGGGGGGGGATKKR